MKYQWGYFGDAHCPSCNAFSELWLVSTKMYDSHWIPMCAYCTTMNLRNTGDEDIEALIKTSPLTSPEIYGEPKPWCVGCGHILVKGTDTVEAQDADGKVHTVHATCTQTCDNCGEDSVSSYIRYHVRLYRLSGDNYVNYMEYYSLLNDEQVCTPCYDDMDLVCCSDCDRYLDCDLSLRFDGNDYCEGCFDDRVAYCDDCDEHYDSNYNHNCENAIIKQFDYKPDPVFFGHREATYYLGLELEVENTSGTYDTEDTAEEVQRKLGNHAYLKHDGSICEGFEIVTHPHTLQSMKEDFNWSVLETLRQYGFRSWNAASSSCGIHVHVSRTAFGQNSHRRVADHKRDAHILRFLKLIYDNQRQVERLAGRSSARWACFNDKGSLVNKVKHGQQDNGRYSAVNTENYNTLEVRVFKGSLKKERVLSAMEFVTAAVEYTRDLKVNGTNKALSWSKFVAYVVANEGEYPNLLSKISDSLANETINN